MGLALPGIIVVYGTLALPEIIVVFGILAIDIALVVWVYRDAVRRGMNAPFWAAIVFFLHAIGLVIYLVARRAPAAVPERLR